MRVGPKKDFLFSKYSKGKKSFNAVHITIMHINEPASFKLREEKNIRFGRFPKTRFSLGPPPRSQHSFQITTPPPSPDQGCLVRGASLAPQKVTKPMCGAKLTDVNATNYAHYILSVNSLYYKRISFDTSTNLSWLWLVGDKLMFHSLKLPLGKNKNFIKENLWRCICEWLEFAGMLFLNVSCGQANNILKAIMQQILSKMHQQLRSLAMPTLYAAIYSWCVVGVFDDQVIMAFNQIR